jgi:hypothetical protein
MTRKNGNIKKRRRKKSMDSKSSEEIESDKYLDLWLKRLRLKQPNPI